VISRELARTLSELSRDTECQIGILVNRKGSITHVIVGDQHGIYIPDLEQFRRSAFRLKGLRCIHTTFSRHKGLTEEDITDLALLRLDCMVVIEAGAGLPGKTWMGYLLPPPDSGGKESDGAKWHISAFAHPKDLPQDFDTFIKELEAEIERKCRLRGVDHAEERAILVHASAMGPAHAERSLAELEQLARTANVDVCSKVYQRVQRYNPAHLMGKGKLKQIVISGLYLGATMIIFDQNLTPVQANNIAKLTDLKVIDRTQLILDIFARHATTRGGKIQVELAQLRYMLPRLVGKGTAMSRLIGGIGTRGPGETKLEIDRRRIKQRIGALERALKQLERQRAQMRKRRKRHDLPQISIIGYTNTGKSTLLNRLTKAGVLAENKLFATLETSVKSLHLGGRQMLLSDTVGFIKDMPPDIMKAFKATLEELEEAWAFIHVVDASSPFLEQEMEATEGLLREMGLEDKPVILVFNKIDLIPDEELVRLKKRHPSAIFISAFRGSGIDKLLFALEGLLKAGGRNGLNLLPGQMGFVQAV